MQGFSAVGSPATQVQRGDLVDKHSSADPPDRLGGSGPRKDRRRLVAFCLVIAGAALMPTQHVERREPDASASPTITTSPWVSGWSMRAASTPRRPALAGGRPGRD
jgi:hypothetical protein